MKSARSILPRYIRPGTALAWGLWLFAAGCGERLTPPPPLASPLAGRQLWGVAPFGNESGVSTVDAARVADAFTAETQQVEGIDTIPVNRVIGAMRALEIEEVSSRTDAAALMTALQLDGLIVGTVTAYQPYRPLALGMAVQLYLGPHHPPGSDLDPRVLSRAIRGDAAPGALGEPGAAAQAAGVFDARNHQTLAWLEEYASGRVEPSRAYGREIYRVSMDAYTNFVCHRLLRELLGSEHLRAAPAAREDP